MDDETNMLYFNLEPPTLDNMTDNLLTALIHCKKEIISHHLLEMDLFDC